MKRVLALVAAGLIAAGFVSACDDAPRGSCDKPSRIDTDDCRPGPGDGVNERGPLR